MHLIQQTVFINHKVENINYFGVYDTIYGRYYCYLEILTSNNLKAAWKGVLAKRTWDRNKQNLGK